MAPIPEDNQDKPPGGSKEDPDFEHFSNTNLPIQLGDTDSSDSDDDGDNPGAPNGYSLLPQEPGDDYSINSDDEDVYSTSNTGDGSHLTPSSPQEASAGGEEGTHPDFFVDSVLSSEDGAVAPTASVSDGSCHPSFLARFPSGKIPSYMQVPKVPKDKEEHLWNQQRPESSKLDSVNTSKILKAMSQFSLPSENIPDWAKNLPEDQWQQQVICRIGVLSARDRHSSDSRLPAPSLSVHSTAHNKDTSVMDDVWVADFPDNDTAQK